MQWDPVVDVLLPEAGHVRNYAAALRAEVRKVLTYIPWTQAQEITIFDKAPELCGRVDIVPAAQHESRQRRVNGPLVTAVLTSRKYK